MFSIGKCFGNHPWYLNEELLTVLFSCFVRVYCFCGVCCCFCSPVSSLQMMCWSEWWMTALPQTSSCWPVTVVQFMLCLSAQTELISSPLRRMEQVSVGAFSCWCVPFVCFCCCGPPGYSVGCLLQGSCIFLLQWPFKSFCGFLCISVAVALQIIVWDSCVFLLLLPSKSFCRVLVHFCCCGPPNHSVEFWCISVAVTLQIIL